MPHAKTDGQHQEIEQQQHWAENDQIGLEQRPLADNRGHDHQRDQGIGPSITPGAHASTQPGIPHIQGHTNQHRQCGDGEHPEAESKGGDGGIQTRHQNLRRSDQKQGQRHCGDHARQRRVGDRKRHISPGEPREQIGGHTARTAAENHHTNSQFASQTKQKHKAQGHHRQQQHLGDGPGEESTWLQHSKPEVVGPQRDAQGEHDERQAKGKRDSDHRDIRKS